MRSCTILLCVCLAAAARHQVYRGYKSYWTHVTDAAQQRVLSELETQFEADALSHALPGRPGVVLVAPQYQRLYTDALSRHNITYSVHSEDVMAELNREDEINERSREASRGRNAGRNVPYDNYQEWEVIDEYMEDIAARYPERVTLVHAANSFEGRPIKYLKISSSNFTDTSKPVIFIDGGIHSREWISPPTVTWAIHKLVEDITESDLAHNVDWILHPVVNPDGYKYTFTDARMWRKTRSTEGANAASCPGIDGNRNYDFAWNTVGTSPNPCADTYAGAAPFSEVETRVVRDIVLEHQPRMALYITMHSYGSMILYPWGHDSTLSWNAFQLHATGVAIAQAIDANQHASFPNYIVGNSGLVIGYEAAGAAEDWAHSVGVPLAYTIELPGLSGGYAGFHLAPEFIERVVQETWTGVVAGARMAISLYSRK